MKKLFDLSLVFLGAVAMGRAGTVSFVPASDLARFETVYGRECVKEYRLIQREMTAIPELRPGCFDPESRREQASHPQATILQTDWDPLDVVLRRTRALYGDLETKVDLSVCGREPDEEERLRLLLFMESNGAHFGHDYQFKKQAAGEVVRPILE